MKEQILKALEGKTKPQTVDQINEHIGLKTVEELNDLQTELHQLAVEGIIHESKSHDYLLMENTKALRSGYLNITKNGNGYVITSIGPDVFVKSIDYNGAINNDFVVVEIHTKADNPNPEGHIIKILRRDLKSVVGEMIKDNNQLIFKADDPKLDIIIKIPKEELKGCVEGHKVIVDIIKEIKVKKRIFLGHIRKIIGHKDDPGVDILTIAAKHNIDPAFSPATMAELKNIPDEVSSIDLKGRRDLTNELIFTIDGDDTKDIDDAISLTKENNHYHLGVHIADVSYYVKIGTSLYDDAYMRGTSSYLADTVIPMLPHQLSNGICSLNPGVVRLTISCEMLIDESGKVKDYDIYPSYIKSRKQMTYKKVNEILMHNNIPEGYEEYKDTLIEMNNLAKLLRKEKTSRGYIDFDIPEAKVIQDETGKAIDIVKRTRDDGENLIEDFMIVANETIAKHINNMDLPFVYRVHDLPSSEKIEDFTNLVKQMGYQINTNMNKLTPLTMQSVLNELRDKKEYSILSNQLLRCMKKAVYSTNNIGHFGLASQDYTHFTSPIRRFPDLTVHRLLRTYLFENRIDNETINYNTKYLIDVAEHSSETEVNAVEAEREVLDMKMAEYMEDKINQRYIGIISGVTTFGMFVQLENLVEGLVHISTLKGHYEYVPELLSLVRDDKAKTYRVGDKVMIKVTSANKDTGMVDFEICEGKNKNGNIKQESKV